MMKKMVGVLVVLLLVVGLAPTGSSTPVAAGWEVGLTSPIVLVGDNVTVSVWGPPSAAYMATLALQPNQTVNSTMPVTLFFGQLDANGTGNFSRRLDLDLIAQPGKYWLNITQGALLVATCNLTVKYDQIRILVLTVERVIRDVTVIYSLLGDEQIHNSVQDEQITNIKDADNLQNMLHIIEILVVIMFLNSKVRSWMAGRGVQEPPERRDKEMRNDLKATNQPVEGLRPKPVSDKEALAWALKEGELLGLGTEKEIKEMMDEWNRKYER